MVQNYTFVMMTKGKWWNRFLSDHREGKDAQAYVQKGAGPPRHASLIFFYVTKPVAEIAGYAEFVQRVVGEPLEVWGQHGRETVLRSEQEYMELMENKHQVSFIRFQKLSEARQALSLVDVLALLGTKRLSRKGFYVDKETAEKMVSDMG